MESSPLQQVVVMVMWALSPSALDRDRVTTGDSVGEELAIIDGTDDAKDGTTGESISY